MTAVATVANNTITIRVGGGEVAQGPVLPASHAGNSLGSHAVLYWLANLGYAPVDEHRRDVAGGVEFDVVPIGGAR
jgi:hypothetical protein